MPRTYSYPTSAISRYQFLETNGIFDHLILCISTQTVISDSTRILHTSNNILHPPTQTDTHTVTNHHPHTHTHTHTPTHPHPHTHTGLKLGTISQILLKEYFACPKLFSIMIQVFGMSLQRSSSSKTLTTLQTFESFLCGVDNHVSP